MSVIVDIFMILSSVATMTIAVCAVMGLSAWKKQHSGKTESDLAIQILASIYKYRDAVDELINPPNDDPTPDSSENKSSLTEKDFKERIELLRERVHKTKSVRQEFYADILRSKALWGEELRLMVDEMPKLETIASKIMTRKLTARNPKIIDHFGPGTRERIEQDIKDLESDGAIEKRFDALINKIENYLESKRL